MGIQSTALLFYTFPIISEMNNYDVFQFRQ